MPDVLIVLDDYDPIDYILQEKLASPAGKILLQLIDECWPPTLTYSVIRVKDLPKWLKQLPEVVLVLGKVAWAATKTDLQRSATTLIKGDWTPAEVILPQLNQRSVEERYLTLKNRFLQISHSLTE